MAAEKRRTQKVGFVMGGALIFIGLSRVGGSLDPPVSQLAAFLGIPLRAAVETVPSILPGVWHMLQPCVIGHLRLLEALLQISGHSWQFVVSLAGVA